MINAGRHHRRDRSSRGLLFGYDIGVISGALLFLRTAFHLSSLMAGVVTSIALAGAAGGAAVAGRLADRFGRRPILLGTATVFVADAIVSAVAGCGGDHAPPSGLPRHSSILAPSVLKQA